MKKIFVLLLLCVSLFAVPPFTLENLQNLRIYFVNNTDFIDKQQELSIKSSVEEKLKSVGIVFNQVDSSTFMIKVESIKVGKTYVINVQIAVGEEVLTKRKEKIGTFAFTYYMSDLIDTDAPYADTLESIHFLVDGFMELYLEDKE